MGRPDSRRRGSALVVLSVVEPRMDTAREVLVCARSPGGGQVRGAPCDVVSLVGNRHSLLLNALFGPSLVVSVGEVAVKIIVS